MSSLGTPRGVRGLTAAELLRRPVRLNGIWLGRVVDVVVDPEGARVLGFDVLCGDAEHRFLPFSAAAVTGKELTVDSTLTFLAESELSFYRSNGRSLLADEELGHAVLGEDGTLDGDAR